VAQQPLQRIGLSATQKPIEAVARWLSGTDGAACVIVNEGHGRPMDLAIEMPRSELDTVMAHEVWEEYYDRLAELAAGHRTTIVFVNTRKMAERLARHLSDRLGDEAVAAHHGSLSKESRLDAEIRLKSGRCVCWWRPHRSSSGSTSAASTWCARSGRRIGSPP
jgi:ATP-dependent Lhr-like helicase